jgi:hypothetical protein
VDEVEAGASAEDRRLAVELGYEPADLRGARLRLDLQRDHLFELAGEPGQQVRPELGSTHRRGVLNDDREVDAFGDRRIVGEKRGLVGAAEDRGREHGRGCALRPRDLRPPDGRGGAAGHDVGDHVRPARCVLHHDVERVVAFGVGEPEDLAAEPEAERPDPVRDQEVDLAAEIVPPDLVVLQHRGHEDRDDARKHDALHRGKIIAIRTSVKMLINSVE